MAHMTSKEESSKNVTIEQVQKRGRIFRRMEAKKRRLDASNNSTAFDNLCDESHVDCRLLETQHEIEFFASQTESP